MCKNECVVVRYGRFQRSLWTDKYSNRAAIQSLKSLRGWSSLQDGGTWNSMEWFQDSDFVYSWKSNISSYLFECARSKYRNPTVLQNRKSFRWIEDSEFWLTFTRPLWCDNWSVTLHTTLLTRPTLQTRQSTTQRRTYNNFTQPAHRQHHKTITTYWQRHSNTSRRSTRRLQH